MQVDAADLGDAQQVVLRGGIAPLGVGDRVLVHAQRGRERLLASRRRGRGAGARRGSLEARRRGRQILCVAFSSSAIRESENSACAPVAADTIIATIRSHVGQLVSPALRCSTLNAISMHPSGASRAGQAMEMRAIAWHAAVGNSPVNSGYCWTRSSPAGRKTFRRGLAEQSEGRSSSPPDCFASRARLGIRLRARIGRARIEEERSVKP